MIGEKHELKVEGAIPNRRGNNSKRSKHSHGCPSPMDIKLLPIHGAKRTKGCGRGRKSDGVTKIFSCHPHLGLKNNKQNFIFNASRDWKPMEMFLDVVGDMGVVTLVGMHVKTSLCVRISVRLSNHHSPLNDYRHIILYVICVHNNKHQVCAMCSLFVNALDAQVWTSKQDR